MNQKTRHPTQIAMIGIGHWGNKLLRNFLQNPRAKIIALVDRNHERLSAAKQQFQLDESVLLATDWNQVSCLPGLEAVVIATPAASHYSLIADALKQGYHVLAEKPLTLKPSECLQLCQLAEENKRQLFVDHTYLFHPCVELAAKTISNGELGQLRYGYASRTHLGPVRQDVDALWDLAAHDICIFNHWLGQFPQRVQAIGSSWLQNPTQPQDKPLTNQLADLVWVTLTYKSGFTAHIHNCWCNPDKQRRLGIVGSQGSLIFDEMQPESPLILYKGYLETIDYKYIPTGQIAQILHPETTEPLARVCERFLNTVEQNTPCPISSGWTGLQIVEILTALTASLQNGGEPILIV